MKIYLLLSLSKKKKLRNYKPCRFYCRKFGSKIWLVHIAAPDPDFVGYEVGPQYIRDHRADELKKEHKLVKKYADELKAKT